jgi:alkaline phosphatase D
MQAKLTRRSVLKSIVVVGAATAIEGCTTETGGLVEGSGAAPFFPQSVASGDPTPASIILWTRVADSVWAGEKTLRLEVAKDAAFTKVVVDKSGLPARAEHDGAIKVKVIGLSAKTTYYYRFSYRSRDSVTYRSRTGQTRTAPAAGDDVAVRFAVANCQDYIGRFWNTYQHLGDLDLDLDFFLSIGDYIYETTGNPSFQTGGNGRNIAFSDSAGALTFGTGSTAYQAAQSLSNYRQLYQNYRSDPVLQRVHERYPIIVTWDDHEFSDDCHGDVATYTNGAKDETEPQRRKNADQAFFEFMPIDDGNAGGVFETGSGQLFPNAKLWRSFQFGQHLELVVTDYRSKRPDHPVPEDAFPGTVILDKTLLLAVLTAQTGSAAIAQQIYNAKFPESVFAYVNIDDPTYAVQKAALLQAIPILYVQAGLDLAEGTARARANVTGNLALVFVNAVITNPSIGLPPISTAGKDRGLAFVQIGKQLPLVGSSIGSRYVVVKDSYDLYCGALYAGLLFGEAPGASEDAFGAEQEQFILSTLTQSTRTWKVLISSTSMTSMQWNLSTKNVPALYQTNFYFDVDQWDGFPNKRAALLAAIEGSAPNTLVVAGDIHASFLSKGGPNGTIAEFTSAAISSQHLASEISDAVIAAGFKPGGTDNLYHEVVENLEPLLKESNPSIVDVNTTTHGFLVIEVGSGAATGTFHRIPASEVTTDYSQQGAATLSSKFTTVAFKVENGTITPA